MWYDCTETGPSHVVVVVVVVSLTRSNTHFVVLGRARVLPGPRLLPDAVAMRDENDLESRD